MYCAGVSVLMTVKKSCYSSDSVGCVGCGQSVMVAFSAKLLERSVSFGSPLMAGDSLGTDPIMEKHDIRKKSIWNYMSSRQ